MILPTINTLLFTTNILVYFHCSEHAWIIRFDTMKYDYSLYTVEWKNITRHGSYCNDSNDIIWKGFAQNVEDKGYAFVKIPELSRNIQGSFCIQVTPTDVEDEGDCENGCTTSSKILKLPDDLEQNCMVDDVEDNSEIDRDDYSEMDDDENFEMEDEEKTCKEFIHSLKLLPDMERGIVTCDMNVKSCDRVKEIKTIAFYLYQRLNGSAAKDCQEVNEENFSELRMRNVTKGACEISAKMTVDPGSYCAVVYFYHEQCGESECTCGTEVKILYDPKDEAMLTNEQQNQLVIYCYMLAVLIFFALVTLVISICRRRRKTAYKSISSTEEIELEDLFAKADTQMKDLEFVVLYTRDFEEHIQVVTSLCNFLSNVWKVGSVRCDVLNEYEIGFSQSSYDESVTCAKPNRRILIVESERAVLQEEAKRRQEALCPEDYLDLSFPHTMELLKQDSRSLRDYRTIFVVKFEYSPEHRRMRSVLPNRRYVLPVHLFHLYCKLLELSGSNFSVDSFSLFEEKMNEKWQGALESDLIQKIEKAKKKLDEDSDVIRNSFQV